LTRWSAEEWDRELSRGFAREVSRHIGAPGQRLRRLSRVARKAAWKRLRQRLPAAITVVTRARSLNARARSLNAAQPTLTTASDARPGTTDPRRIRAAASGFGVPSRHPICRRCQVVPENCTLGHLPEGPVQCPMAQISRVRLTTGPDRRVPATSHNRDNRSSTGALGSCLPRPFVARSALKPDVLRQCC